MPNAACYVARVCPAHTLVTWPLHGCAFVGPLDLRCGDAGEIWPAGLTRSHVVSKSLHIGWVERIHDNTYDGYLYGALPM